MQLEIKQAANELVFEATGTTWRILFSDTTPLDTAAEIISMVVDDFEKQYSRFRDDSLVASISKRSGEWSFGSTELFEFYKSLSAATNNRITPSIAKNLEQAGYDMTYSLQPTSLTNIEDWLSIISWNEDSVSTKAPVSLDFGAAGKGYLIDLLARSLEQFEWLRINGGGDILVSQSRHIILEHPDLKGKGLGTIQLEDESICSSSFNRRDWGAFHHIIDPDTKESPRDNVTATWVVSSTAMHADGIATALFLSAPEELAPFFDFEYAILRPTGALEMSPGFKKRLISLHTENT